MTDVSVVIPTHNRPAGLTAMLADLCRQDLGDISVEVIVVDSPEGHDVSAVVDKALEGSLDVRLLMTRNTLGGKRNAGAGDARGALLIFADDDMRLPKNWVRAHVDAHASHPRSLVSGAVEFPSEWVAASNYHRYKNGRHLNATRISSDGPISPNRVVMMNGSVPRDVYLSAGGTSSAFEGYGGEDVEFGYRLARCGVTLWYSAAAVAEHHELTADVVEFMEKVRKASFSSGVVMAMVPEAVNAPTFRWNEPHAQRTFLDKLVHGFLVLVSQPILVGGLGKALLATDRWRWAYCPFLYKVLTLMNTQLGVKQREQIAENEAAC